MISRQTAGEEPSHLPGKSQRLGFSKPAVVVVVVCIVVPAYATRHAPCLLRYFSRTPYLATVIDVAYEVYLSLLILPLHNHLIPVLLHDNLMQYLQNMVVSENEGFSHDGNLGTLLRTWVANQMIHDDN